MCDQYNNRGCEVVDELYLEITNLEMSIADLKVEFVEDLKEIDVNDGEEPNDITELIEKWMAK